MFDIKKFKDIFLIEATEHLQKLNDNLLALEKLYKLKDDDKKNQISELLNELMRSSHTMKSSSAAMGYSKLAYLMHVLEDIFDFARYGKLDFDKKIFDFLYEIFDSVDKSLKEIKNNDKELDVQKIADKIKKITGVKTVGTGKSIKNETSRDMSVANKATKNNLSSEKISSINVSVEKLDELMNLTEELLINRLRLNSYIEKISGKVLTDIKEISDNLGSTISSLQYSVMQARLVPVRQAFINFTRLVRDLAEKQNKEIDFEIIGSDLELDRTIVDKLQDPVIHLLRNAVDHGIIKNGKIKIITKREKDYFTVEVVDYGQGINWLDVVKVAKDRAIISQETYNLFRKELESVKNKTPSSEIVKLIFHPNLSTAKQVTETSGRGVGLSVVENFVKDIHGNIVVQSPFLENTGTRFILELPLTLAIIKALLVRVGNQKFAIPFTVIDRAVLVPLTNIKSLGDQDIAVINDQDVPLIRVDKVFEIDFELKQNKKENIKNLTVVLVRRGQEFSGIVVDELINQQEIIVKPLPEYIRGVKGFAGSSILGNGQTILILDTLNMISDIKKITRI